MDWQPPPDGPQDGGVKPLIPKRDRPQGSKPPRREPPPPPVKPPFFDYVDAPMLSFDEFCYHEHTKNRNGEGEAPKPDDGGDKHPLQDKYDDYRADFGTTILRSFFNVHIDDEWFRDIYSPLNLTTAVDVATKRAVDEAEVFIEEIEGKIGGGSGGDDGAVWWSKYALSTGVSRPPAAATKGKRKYSDASTPSPEAPVNVTPVGHLNAYEIVNKKSDSTKTLQLEGVPPYCSDKVLASQLKSIFNDYDRDATKSPPPFTIISGRVNALSRLTKDKTYNRVCWVLFETDEFYDEFVDACAYASASSGGKGIKSLRYEGMRVKIAVEDLFGRKEVDGDNKGSEYDPKNPTHEKPDFVRQTCAIAVKSFNERGAKLLEQESGSPEQILKDKDISLLIAAELDSLRGVPEKFSMKNLVEKMTSDSSGDSAPTLVLDVCVAYLRRVHMYLFYDAHLCEREGEMLEVKTAIRRAPEPSGDKEEGAEAPVIGSASTNSTISTLRHQRLQKSLDFLKGKSKQKEENLNARHSEEIDELSDNLKVEVEETKNIWLENHAKAVPNEETGEERYRCSFHFCKKLFKNRTFLDKHLLKKHPEFLAGEEAKAHDDFMKICWESAETRTCLPEVMVRIPNFGIHPVPIKGTFSRPMIHDPHPAFAAEEEARARANYEREEKRRREFEGDRRGDLNVMDDRPVTTFVDADDLRDESKEVVFSSEKLDGVLKSPPSEGKKKKKKKRRLD